jgi:predicted nucleic acid-binding protein
VPGGIAYLDSSAFLKLVVAESESRALRRRLREWPDRAASVLLRVEVVRALRRSGNDAHVENARRLFKGLHLLRIDEPLLDRAGDLGPWVLRSFDAIHVATALSIGVELEVAVTYDERQRTAFENAGIAVVAPT